MYILVQANDVKEAYDNTIVIMENAMVFILFLILLELKLSNNFAFIIVYKKSAFLVLFFIYQHGLFKIEKPFLLRSGFLDSF
jgi:hypothetical protein